MDPLSILAGTFTLCDGTIKILRVFKELRDAPNELQGLIEEVSGLKTVVEGAESAVRNSQCGGLLPSDQLHGLNIAVSSVNDNLQKLCKIVESCSRKTSSRRVQLLRQQEKIKSQRQALRDAKLDLLVALGASTL